MLRALYITLISAAACSALCGQSLVGQLSQNPVREGEQFRLEYTLTGNASFAGFTEPSLKDFTVITGPVQYTQTSFSKRGTTTTPSVYYILSCPKEGNYTIGAASAQVAGKIVTSAELKITVLAAPVVQTANTMSFRCVPSRNSCLNGEMVNCKLQIVSPTDNLVSVMQINAQSNTNADVPAVTMNGSITKSLESSNGTTNVVYDVGNMTITPKKEGKIDLPQPTVDAVFMKQEKFSDPFSNDPLFSDPNMNMPAFTMQVPSRVTLKAEVPSLQVSSPPQANMPSNYNGAVGNNFSLNCTLDRNTVHANEALKFNVTVIGQGDLNSIQAPNLQMPTGFDTYPPNTADSTSSDFNKRSFEYVAVPRQEGNYTIPSTNFSYYDAEKKGYVNLATPEFSVNVVSPGTVIPELNIAARATQKTLNENLLPLKSIAEGHGAPFFGSSWFLILLTLPILAFSIFIWQRQNKLYRYEQEPEIAQQEEPSPEQEEPAPQPKVDPLAAAQIHLLAENPEAFYEALEKGLYGYIGDFTGLAAASLSRATINQRFAEQNVDSELSSRLFTILDTCALARYARSSGETQEMQQLFDDTAACLAALEAQRA